ncbi:MAG TPA: hypothetical protein VFZ37_16250 [Jiangellaceae bacterium]
MSTLAFWLLMLLVVLFVVAVVGVGLAVRRLFRRTHRMFTELDSLSSDITDIVRSGERG